jgi:pimeloyl-ACP methyl ester carboxylesterase
MDVDPEPYWRWGAAAARYLTQDGQDGRGHFTFDFTTHLAAFTRPVLFVAGDRSDVLGPSLQREQLRAFPSATLTVVTGAGHDVHWTHTADVLAAVRPYLAALEGR